MLITEQFTRTIIAAYGNHNKDEHALEEETCPTHLVCRGKSTLTLNTRAHLHAITLYDNTFMEAEKKDISRRN